MSQTDAAHLDMTAAFIAENPSSITLSRRTKVSTGTGGWRWGTATSQPPIVARLVGQQNRFRDEITTDDGQVVVPSKVLIAMPGEDIRRGDQFAVVGEGLHEVVKLNDTPKWRINAQVYVHAS